MFEQDGLWINKVRQKVKTAECYIPLSAKAVKILQKYNFEMPIVSNEKYNTHLKTIAALFWVLIRNSLRMLVEKPMLLIY